MSGTALHLREPMRRAPVSPAPCDEHAAVLRAVAGFDRTLVHPRSRGLPTYRRRLQRSVMPVVACLREHCESSERGGGTLASVEIALGRLHQITAARREHRLLMKLVTDLCTSLATANGDAYPPAVAYRRAAELMSGIRAHCRSEVDLIQLRFNLDVGVVD